jgi:hypothetical protein
MESTKDFFISFNHNDRAWAEWIAWTLEEKGYTTIIQSWDFLPGSNFALEMKKGLASARRMLAVLSPNYLSSKFAQAEWAAVFARDPTGEKRILLPVRVADIALTSLDATIVYIDLLQKTETECQADLLKGVEEVARLKPSNKPAFPGAAKPDFPGSTKSAPANRSVNSLLAIGVVLVAVILYYWMARPVLQESTLQIKSSQQEKAQPVTDTATPAKKPVGTLTLKEEHQ